MEMSSRHLHIFLLTKTAKANNDPLYEKLFTFCMNICYILRLCYIINTARELLLSRAVFAFSVEFYVT